MSTRGKPSSSRLQMASRWHLAWLLLIVALLSLLLPLVHAEAEVEQASSLSTCQLCELTGDCAQAFRGMPGQFCGHWLDRANQRQSCCCPTNAICRVSNYACTCSYVSRVRGGAPRSDPLLWLWWLLGFLGLVALCIGCAMCVCRARSPTQDREIATPVPTAYPATAPPMQSYGAPDSVPVAPAMGGGYAAPAPAAYAAAPARSGMGAGTAAALGGAGGLIGGMLLGEALADRGGRAGGFDSGYDGGVGDYGVVGGDDGGDFGGDF